jgi:lysozyme family protein
MPSVNYTQSLQQHYKTLYSSCEVKDSRYDDVDTIIEPIVANQPRYEQVSADTGAPWYVVAAIHNMEAGQRFDRHLHNGDRLTARTVHVPKGRPVQGSPPFTWEERARDALLMHKFDEVSQWNLPRVLYELERYNGWGYRMYHAHVNSPYLWGFSDHYTSGKYVADGTWSDTAASRQCGAAVIIRRLEEQGHISPLSAVAAADGPVLRYAHQVIPKGAELQRFLNTFEGISIRVDGWPGERSSDAVEKVFGFRLDQDPRDQ